MPVLAEKADGGYFVIGKIADDKVLIQDPLERRPLNLPREVFERAWSGRVIMLRAKKGSTGTERRFDFTWFIPAIVKYRHLLGEVLLASFFLQIFALLTPLFFQVVIDKVLVHQGLTTLDVLAVGLITVMAFEVVLGGLRGYLLTHTTSRIDVELGARIFRHLAALPLGYFQARRVGDSVARVRELENIRNFLTGQALTSLIDSFFIFVFLAVMWYYSPLLTWIVLGSIPCYAVLSIVVTPILRARLDERFNRGAENQAFLVESVTGIETLKSMAVEPQMQRRWEDQMAGYVRASFKSQNLSNVAGQCANFISKVTTLLILWIGAREVIAGNLSVGQLVAFNMLAGRVSGPILRVVRLWQDFQQAGVSVQRLGDILNVPTEPTYNPNRSTLPAIRGAVEFDRVTFRYRPDRAEAIKALSLKAEAGEVIGLVGQSGSGKSTLTKLLQRLYVPESGRVLVDGIDLSTIDPAWLRRQIGVVLQDNILFNRTIRENIALADPSLSMDKVVEAAKVAGAHAFIVEMPEGYDTQISENGANLSGGQRQRVAIARALITDPKILIFDEATSALDYESEAIIQNNMQSISSGRTVFIIAHRLSAVRQAHRIIVLERGTIVEAGSHRQLMQSQGSYARLNALQNTSK